MTITITGDDYEQRFFKNDNLLTIIRYSDFKCRYFIFLDDY
jgi:hypothetical protein